MAHVIKPLDDGDTGGRKVMRPPHSLEVIRAIPRRPATAEPMQSDQRTSTTTISPQYILEHQKRITKHNVPNALEEALTQAEPNGIVLSMPELIAARVQAPIEHALWDDWHNTHSEEHIGIGTHSRRGYGTNTPVLVVLHGGGLLTPTRMRQAHRAGLPNGLVTYTQEEFDQLLMGNLPCGSHINLYTLQEIMQGRRPTTGATRRYGIVMPFEQAQQTTSGLHKKHEFILNPLVITRAGGTTHLGNYFDKATDDDTLQNQHGFAGYDLKHPEGRLLVIDDANNITFEQDFRIRGDFIVVPPYAHSEE